MHSISPSLSTGKAVAPPRQSNSQFASDLCKTENLLTRWLPRLPHDNANGNGIWRFNLNTACISQQSSAMALDHVTCNVPTLATAGTASVPWRRYELRRNS